MNMKSKFFGLNAKLALAVLAVGTMFTSCYDSENGDVVKPYEPADAVYYVAGTVTDVETGAALNAEVTVNGVAATITDGNYSAKGQVGENTVSVKMAGYNNDQPVERKVNIEAVAAGQSYTAVVNVALSKDAYSDKDVDVTVSIVKDQEIVRLTAAENVGLDLTADDDAAEFERTFEVVRGYAVMNQYTASDKLNAYIEKYLGENVGQYGGFKYELDTQTISLKPWDCLVAVSYIYDLDEKTYTFITDEETVTVEVRGVAGYEFGNIETQPNHNFTHSHGHGHGAEGNLNAGGGILDPEM